MNEAHSRDGISGTLLASLGALLLVLTAYAVLHVVVWVGGGEDGAGWTPRTAAAAVLTGVWAVGAIAMVTSRARRQRTAGAITVAAVVIWVAVAFDWAA